MTPFRELHRTDKALVCVVIGIAFWALMTAVVVGAAWIGGWR